MSIARLDDLSSFKKLGSFGTSYPPNIRTFYSPGDDIHGAIKALIASAEHSLVLNLYGYDDDEFDALIREKLSDASIFVQISLDKSQAGGVHEKAILAKWKNDAIGNSIAIGHSARGAISHLKLLIVDGLDVVSGSTNWSASGEMLQDNECTIVRDAVRAAEARTRLDIVHDAMLAQMLKAAPAA